MGRYILQPEVAGQIGSDAILDHSVKPPRIIYLHYEFDDWLGDDLLEGFQCFLCTDALSTVFEEHHLTGFEVASCKIGKSQLFYDLNEDDLEFPNFVWLKIIGAKKDDFFLTSNHSLVVNEKVLSILKLFNIEHCAIEEFKDLK